MNSPSPTISTPIITKKSITPIAMDNPERYFEFSFELLLKFEPNAEFLSLMSNPVFDIVLSVCFESLSVVSDQHSLQNCD